MKNNISRNYSNGAADSSIKIRIKERPKKKIKVIPPSKNTYGGLSDR